MRTYSSFIILYSSFCFALTLILSNGESNAQDSLTYTSKSSYPVNVIKTNPLAALVGQNPLTGELKLMYERAIGSKMAGFIGISYNTKGVLKLEQLIPDTIDQFKTGKINGYRIQAGYKFYLTKFSIPVKGFYVAPHFSYNNSKINILSDRYSYFRGTLFNINALTGYQFIAGGSFAFDIFTGLGYKSNTWEIFNKEGELVGSPNKSGLKVSFGFNFGYAF